MKKVCKKEITFLPLYDERARYDNPDLGFFSEANPASDRLNRSLGSSPLSGTLNVSLWIAEVLVLKLKYRRWPKDKARVKLLPLAELASLFAISRAINVNL